MATYIQGLTGLVPQTPLYTPDYSFLSQKLAQKDMMYDQGLAKANNLYNSIRTAALTKDDNKLARDQYIKDAQDQLKKIAASDLSLVENQNAAESVFAPFWEDNDIMTDYLDTKAQSSEMKKQYELQNSASEEVRDTFSTIPLALMQDRMQKIKYAKRGDMSVYEQSVVKSTPFYNVYKEAEKFVKDNDWKITRVNAANGMIETITNGAGTEMTFAQLIQQIRGTKYQAQDEMMGRYHKLNAINNIKSDYKAKGIDLSDEQAVQYIPEYYGGHYVEQLKEAQADINKRKEILVKKGSEMKANGANTTLAEMYQLCNDIEQLEKQSAGYDEDIQKWSNKDSEEYKNLARNISYSPERFFADSFRTREINAAARLLASKQSRKLEEDKSYWEAKKLEQENILKHDQMFNEQILQRMKEDGSGGSGSGSGNGAGGGMFSDINRDGINDLKQKEQVNVAYNTPTVENAKSSVVNMNPLENARTFILNERSKAIAQNFDIFRDLPESMVGKYITSEEASVLHSLLNGNDVTDPKYNKVDQKTYDNTINSISTRLKTNGIIGKQDKLGGPGSIMNMISSQLIKDIETSIDNANKYPENEELRIQARKQIAAWSSLTNNQKILNNLFAKEKLFNESVNKEMSKEGYEKVRVKDGDNYTMINPDYIAKKYNVPRDVAMEYLDGNLKVKEEDVYKLVNTSIGATGAFDHTEYTVEKDGKTYNISKLVDLYGKSKDIKKSIEAAKTKAGKVIQDSFYDVFKDETAAMGRVITYRSDGDNKKDDMGQEVVQDILNTGMKYESRNDSNVVNLSGNAKEFADALLQRVRTNPGEGLTDVKLYTISPVNSGFRAVRLNYSVEQIRKLFTDDELKNMSGYKDFINKGEGILLELRHNETVKGFPTAATRGYYEMLLTENTGKKIIKNSPLEEKLGARYEMYRDYQGNIRYKASTKIVVPDPNNPGKVMEKWVDPQDPNTPEDMISEKIMPAGVDPETFVTSLQQSAGQVFLNNSRTVSTIVKPVPSLLSSDKALQERMKALGIK